MHKLRESMDRVKGMAFFGVSIIMFLFFMPNIEVQAAGMDVTTNPNVVISSAKLQVNVNGNWEDVSSGEGIQTGQSVRFYINWCVTDMTGIDEADYFLVKIEQSEPLFTFYGQSGSNALMDGSKHAADYTISTLDDITTIRVEFTSEGAMAASLEEGYLYVGGMASKSGNNVIAVNNTSQERYEVNPSSPGRMNPDILNKEGASDGNEDRIAWTISINRKNVIDGYAGIYSGNPTAAPAQSDLILIDELLPGQFISMEDVQVCVPVFRADGSGGDIGNDCIDTWNVTPLFETVEKSVVDGLTKEEFKKEIMATGIPTIGIYNDNVLYVYFGNINNDGSSMLNIQQLYDSSQIHNVSDDESLSEQLKTLMTDADADVVYNYFARSGVNGGDFNSCITILHPVIAGEEGVYHNEAALEYDSESGKSDDVEQKFKFHGGGVTFNSGSFVLTKADEANTAIVLAGASFCLEKQNMNGAGWTDLGTYVTDGNGQIAVGSLKYGTYRITEVIAPQGYQLDSTPIEFTIAPGKAFPLQFYAKNSLDGTTPSESSPIGESTQDTNAMPGLPKTGDKSNKGLWMIIVSVSAGILGNSVLISLKRKADLE